MIPQAVLESPTKDLDGECGNGPFFKKFDSGNYKDSRVAAKDLFTKFISPIGVEFFFRYIHSNGKKIFFYAICENCRTIVI